MVKKIVNLIFIIAWMVIVFTFSNQGGTESSGISGKVTNKIDNIFHITQGCSTQDIKIVRKNIEHIIRKMAHYSIYALGGFLIYFEINMFKLPFVFKVLFAQMAGSLYACTDEMHQMFIPGRTADIRDVVIDSCGVFAGIIVSIIIVLILDKIDEYFKYKKIEGGE